LSFCKKQTNKKQTKSKQDGLFLLKQNNLYTHSGMARYFCFTAKCSYVLLNL